MQNKDYPRLLDCPFCGGIPAVVEDGYKAIAVHCFNCGADITAESEKKARAAWNRRAQPADVETVRHGKWLSVCGCIVRCDLCRNESAGETNYCPNCGAKMDKEDEI